MDLDKVKADAKQIIDVFSEKLSPIQVSDKEPLIEREKYEREEGEGIESDKNFKKIMLENAPNKQNDSIFAEKKRWE